MGNIAARHRRAAMLVTAFDSHFVHKQKINKIPNYDACINCGGKIEPYVEVDISVGVMSKTKGNYCYNCSLLGFENQEIKDDIELPFK